MQKLLQVNTKMLVMQCKMSSKKSFFTSKIKIPTLVSRVHNPACVVGYLYVFHVFARVICICKCCVLYRPPYLKLQRLSKSFLSALAHHLALRPESFQGRQLIKMTDSEDVRDRGRV